MSYEQIQIDQEEQLQKESNDVDSSIVNNDVCYYIHSALIATKQSVIVLHDNTYQNGNGSVKDQRNKPMIDKTEAKYDDAMKGLKV